MTDQSFLDDQYFVDETVYNCPFCNRRHVRYSVYDMCSFDWTPENKCYAYFVVCHSCRKESMHLTNEDISFRGRNNSIHFDSDICKKLGGLDNLFFYSVPTSFFVLDKRVPNKLRKLLTEAEGSLKSNFLTGASACARKIVYELANLNNITNEYYEDQIKSLKKKHPQVDETFFDNLLTIQKTTSSKVHENSYDGWESRHVRLILSALREILHELYVAPAQLKDRRQKFLELSGEVLGGGASPSEDAVDANSDGT